MILGLSSADKLDCEDCRHLTFVGLHDTRDCRAKARVALGSVMIPTPDRGNAVQRARKDGYASKRRALLGQPGKKRREPATPIELAVRRKV